LRVIGSVKRIADLLWEVSYDCTKKESQRTPETAKLLSKPTPPQTGNIWWAKLNPHDSWCPTLNKFGGAQTSN